MEREFTLKDLLVVILRNIKQVIAWALVFGVLFGGYGMYSSYHGSTAVETVGGDLGEQKSAVENAVRRLEEQIEKMDQYLENSIYHSIDPYNKGVGSVLFYVDTGYEVNPNLSYQTPNPTKDVIMAYKSLYRYDEEILQQIYELMGKKVDKKYILELIKVENEESNIVSITVAYEDAQVALNIARYIYQASEEKIRESVIEHTTRVLSSNAGYEIDDAMYENQMKNETTLEELRTSLEEKSKDLKALTEAEVSVETNTGVSLVAMVKKGVLFGIVGLVLGLIVGAVVVFVLTVLEEKIQNVSDAERFGLPLLGIVPSKDKKHIFAKWIQKLEGDPAVGYEEAASLVAANLALMIGKEKALLVSTGRKSFATDLANSLGDQAEFCGNILQDAAAVETLKNFESIVLVEERGTASLSQVKEEIDRLKALNKTVVGIVLR